MKVIKGDPQARRFIESTEDDMYFCIWFLISTKQKDQMVAYFDDFVFRSILLHISWVFATETMAFKSWYRFDVQMQSTINRKFTLVNS